MTELEAGDDRNWFAAHPSRRFRARWDVAHAGWWLIRKRGDALFRTFTRAAIIVPDRDKAIAPWWFAAAWPELFAQSVRKARRTAGGRR